MAQDIHQYISERLDEGHHPDAVKAILRKHGHPPEMVNEYFTHPKIKGHKKMNSGTGRIHRKGSLGYIATWKELLDDPKGFLGSIAHHPHKQTFKFFVLSSVIGSSPLALFLMVMLTQASLSYGENVGYLAPLLLLFVPLFVTAYVTVISFAWSLSTYVMGRLVAGKLPFSTVWSIFAYGMGPPNLLMSLPVISLIGFVGWLILVTIGLRENYKVSTGKAIGIFALGFVGIIAIVSLAIMILVALLSFVMQPAY